MNPQSFLENFEHIVAAPNAHQQIRELIIQLAVQGRLVTQHHNDESAEKLLVEIKEERRQLENEGIIGKQHPLPPIRSDEHPFKLPTGWVWERLGQLVTMEYGKSLPEKARNRQGQIPVYGSNGIVGTHDQALIHSPAIIVGRKGSSGALNISRQPCWPTDVTYYMIPPQAIDLDFCFILFRSLHLEELGKGIKPGLNRKEAYTLVAALPPLPEQKRIVMMVNKCMRLCYDLEGQQAKLAEACSKANQAALNALVHSDTDNQLGIAWSRISQYFLEFQQDQSGIDALKEAILGLAYEGRLTRQWRAKGGAREDALSLIEAIQRKRNRELTKADGQREKELLQVKRKLARQKIENLVDPIPQKWVWVTLLKASELLVDCHNKTAPYVHQGIHLVRTTDIRNGAMDLRHTRKVSQETYEYWSRRCPPTSGDIIFTREAPMGEAAIVPPDEIVCLGQRTMLIRVFEEYIDREYLLYALYEAKFKERMLKAAIGMTVKHLRVGDVEDLVIPLAPLEEQKEIVRQIKKYFGYCDQLADQLSERASIHDKLSASAISAIVSCQPQVVGRKEFQEKGEVPQKGRHFPSVLLRVIEAMKKQIANTELAKLLQEHGEAMEAQQLWKKSGLSIDDFYAALKQEIKEGFIAEPEVAQLKLVEVSD